MANSILSRFNFAIGRNPKIERRKDWRRFIPEPYFAVVLLQADFEMAWAWRWSKRFSGNIHKALEMARMERRNIPAILDLCDEFMIPITWATVGHLMLEGCRRQGENIHMDIHQLKRFTNEFWDFPGGDWFKHDPGTDVRRDPEWYASDLVEEILRRKTRHEIGCHTFSHIDCSDEVCPPEILREEIKKCKKIAKELGIVLRSFVHPGYTIGNLDVLAQEDFSNFRTNYRNVLGFPKKHTNGIWELEQTAEIIFRKEWSIDYHVNRYIRILKRAIRSNSVCILWFHPSFDPVVVKKILPEIFSYLNENKDKIMVITSGNYMEELR